MYLMERLGVIGVVIKGDRSVSVDLQHILSDYGDNIIGRMGLPDAAKGIYVISLIFRGTNEQFSAICGKIGRLKGVNVKSAITSVEI